MHDSESHALLTMAQYSGTLAGARCLASHGVSVTIAQDGVLGAAAWSHAARRRVRCPSMADGRRMLDWLVAFGERDPGAVLHPTCDNLAWLIARHQETLAPHFALYVPPFSALDAVLDKRRLYDAAVANGLSVPRTWAPSTEQEALALADGNEALVVKPRSQVFFTTMSKGAIVRGRTELLRVFRELRASPHERMVLHATPDVELPIVQEFVPSAAHDVYSITGFADRAGRIHGARGAVKILQRRGLGVGLCFETAEVEPALLSGLERLCRSVGYFGILEAEFVADEDRRLLIDFNPRYYGQMGFDVARGVPLPWMLHLGALGREAEIGRAVEPRASAWDGPTCYRDEIALRSLLALGQLAGNVEPSDAGRWRSWLSRHRADAVDSSISGEDIVPGLIGAIDVMYSMARHPRSSMRELRK
ncbi:MAG TPA: hypothetical protein VHE30_12475 [Polyangiaceae bacterium]|nr:hypothetical protein [Polyangiaceae bacterium]